MKFNFKSYGFCLMWLHKVLCVPAKAVSDGIFVLFCFVGAMKVGPVVISEHDQFCHQASTFPTTSCSYLSSEHQWLGR